MAPLHIFTRILLPSSVRESSVSYLYEYSSVSAAPGWD